MGSKSVYDRNLKERVLRDTKIDENKLSPWARAKLQEIKKTEVIQMTKGDMKMAGEPDRRRENAMRMWNEMTEEDKRARLDKMKQKLKEKRERDKKEVEKD